MRTACVAPLVSLLFCLVSAGALGSPESTAPQSFDLDFEANSSALTIPAAEAFVRTVAVLDHFDIEPDPDSQPFITPLEGLHTAAEIQKILPVLDPTNSFAKFMTLDGSDLTAYQDFTSRTVLDYHIDLRRGSRQDQVQRTDTFHARIVRAQLENTSDRPLQGLRIALDPGHMGGDAWDERSGKFVRDRQRRKVSEGVIALQTALLLERAFKQLGAEVLVTRRGLHAVTDLDYETYELSDFARTQLAKSTLLPWFQRLLATAPAGAKLFSNFERSTNVKALFSENVTNRWNYFFLGADLQARVDMISAFKPDITLIIHYDTVDPPGNPTGVGTKLYDKTKAYVVGSYEPAELSRRKDRRVFSEHLLDRDAWNASLKLGQAVISKIRTNLGLEYDTTGGGVSSQYAPGIFARNLNVSRGLTRSAVSYLEVLHYNDPREFERLLEATNPMEIDGVQMPYADRVGEVASTIQDAVVEFVKNYRLEILDENSDSGR